MVALQMVVAPSFIEGDFSSGINPNATKNKKTAFPYSDIFKGIRLTYCLSLSFAGINQFRFRGSSRCSGNSQALKPPLGYLKYTAIKESVSSVCRGDPAGRPYFPFTQFSIPPARTIFLCLSLSPCSALYCVPVLTSLNVTSEDPFTSLARDGNSSSAS